jgi:hypothetical protein
MWDMFWATEPSPLSPHSNLGIATKSSSQSRAEAASGISELSLMPTPDTSCCPTTLTLNQYATRAPESTPHLTLQFSTEQLQPNPVINAHSFASHSPPYLPSLSLERTQFHWQGQGVAGTRHALTPSPNAASVPYRDHEIHFAPESTQAYSVFPQNPVIPDITFNHETLTCNPNAEAAGWSSSQSTGVPRLETRHNRVDRHQRLATSHPYTVPPTLSNSMRYEPPPRTEGAGNHSEARCLTQDTFEWLFAVMYPKRRPDKKKPTPSGPCQLCDSTCKRAGILQQHVTILHRQRLARKHLAGKPYDLRLALAFVVAQVLCEVVVNVHIDTVRQESQTFLAALRDNPAGLGPLVPGTFPSLCRKLDEFSRLESWVGVRCQQCGMWATRPVALEEHASICSGAERTPVSPNSENGSKEPIRLTVSGLAARPNRGPGLGW